MNEKCVLISVRPQWCELIANGKKTIEVRKTRPKLETPFKCYIYQTKPKDRLITILKDGDENYGETYHGKPVFIKTYGNGYWTGRNQKVIGEFVCDEIITVDCDSVFPFDKERKEYINAEACLDRDDFWKYTHGLCAYGWHISALQIYDKPMELSEFYHPLSDKDLDEGNYDITCGGEVVCLDYPEGSDECVRCPYGGRKPLKCPPQSWSYVEELEEPCKTKN